MITVVATASFSNDDLSDPALKIIFTFIVRTEPLSPTTNILNSLVPSSPALRESISNPSLSGLLVLPSSAIIVESSGKKILNRKFVRSVFVVFL